VSQINETALSKTLVTLFKNVIYKEQHFDCWEVIISHKLVIEDYVRKIGLTLVVDEIDGYAFLKQRIYGDDEDEIPRLMPRHQLSYNLSILLMLLRKLLQEFDTKTGDRRLILSSGDIIERMKLYLPDTTNEAKLTEDMQKNIDKAVSMGFLRRLRGDDNNYEVLRIARSFVDAEHLEKFNTRLGEYQSPDNQSDAPQDIKKHKVQIKNWRR